MTSDDENNENNKMEEIFEIGSKEELNLLISTYDKKGYLSWDIINENKDDEVDFTPILWAKLIDKEVITDNGDRKYDLERRSEITKYLSGNWSNNDQDEESDEEEVNYEDLPDLDYEKTKWSIYDKSVAMVAAVCMVGFSYGPIREIIYGILSLGIDPINSILPLHMTIFVLAVITSIWSAYVRERLISTDISDFKENLNALKNDDDSGGVLTDPDSIDDKDKDKMSKIQLSMMKSQIKPFGWIMVGTIPIIIWIFTTATIVGDYGMLSIPLFGDYPWSGNVIGPLRTWIFWYMICSVTLTQIVQKIIDW